MKTKVASLTILISFLLAYSFFLNNYSNENNPKEKKQSGAMQAMQFWTACRAYPGTDIPSDKYFSEYVKAKRADKISAYPEFSDQWTSIGPHNIGGRTLAVAFNPQNPATIFAGSASGGLWRSYTGGKGAQAWELVPTGYPVLGVSTIAIEQADSNVIYIGTGEVYNYQNSVGGVTIRTTRGSYGVGILKSTDYGLTWTKSLDWSYEQERGVWAVKIDPVNPDIIWAATTEGTYKSNNAGATWTNVHSVIMGNDLAINPNDHNMIWVAYGNLNSAGKGIYRTTDGGTTWAQLTNGVPSNFGGKIQLTVHAAIPDLIYASVGFGDYSGAGTTLIKSTNAGTNWTTVSTMDYSTYQGWYSHFIGVNPQNPNIMIAGGIDLFKSTNGGQNFIQKSYWYNWYLGLTLPGEPEGPPDYSHADHHAIAYHPANPNIIYFGNDGGVFRSTDGGETFEGCNGGYQSTQFYNYFGSSRQDSNVAIGGLQDNATAVFQGTDAWYRTIGGDGTSCGIDPVDDNIMYGTYQYLALQRSTNGGVSWSYIAPPSSNEGFVAPFVVSVANPQLIYAAGDKVHKSTNRGSSWTTTNGGLVLDGNPLLSLATADTDPNVCYAGTSPINSRAKIFVTTNGGTSWQNVTGTLPDRYPMDIQVDPFDPQTAYVVFSGFGTSHLFKTTDGGTNWIDIGAGLPDVHTSAVAIDPDYPDFIYAGNDLGVYVSPDRGETWYDFNQGINDAVMVMDLSISVSNRKIRAVTHGSGVFERALADDSIIPVELISFTASAMNNYIKLSWSTSSEVNNYGFELQRSINRKDWSNIGFVKGAGTTTQMKNYLWNDENPIAGTSYYRLVQVDFNRTKKIYPETEVSFAGNFELYQNFPNPFNPVTNISFFIPVSGKTSIIVYDASGAEVSVVYKGNLEQGKYTFQFEGKNLASGIYFVKAEYDNLSQVKKMVLLR